MYCMHAFSDSTPPPALPWHLCVAAGIEPSVALLSLSLALCEPTNRSGYSPDQDTVVEPHLPATKKKTDSTFFQQKHT